MEGMKVVIWLALIAFLLFIALAFISAFSPMPFYGMMGPWMMGFGWAWMFLIPILLVLIGVGLYFLITGSETRRDRALEIARERYARGEITKEEFERITRDLK